MNPVQKVVILGSAYPLRGGGIATFNERLAQAYLEQGYEVEIITFSLQYPSFLFPGKTQLSEEEPPKGLNIKVMVNSINPFNWWKVGKMICKMAPDLMVVRYWIPFMSPCLGSIARLTKKNKKTKVVAIVDNIIPHEKRPFDKLLSNYFIKSIDAFITMSESVLKDLNFFDNKKPKKYIRHPLYDNFGQKVEKAKALQNLGLDPAFKYLLFFGFIRDYKGLDLLLEAMAKPAIRQMPLKLLVAGEFYSSKEKYLQQIKQLSIENQLVLHTDFIPNAAVANYFSAADLVVQPYKDATQSGVTQVAYHFEIPIITTNVGGLAEIIPDGKVGYVVAPDAQQIATVIERFFAENKFAAFEAAMKEEKKKFSWQGMIDAINTVASQA